MINKTLMTAGAFILSMMVLFAGTNANAQEVGQQDHDRQTLSGIVIDADLEDAIPNATVYIKKKNGEDGMQTDRTQQDHQQQQQRDRAAEHDQDELDSTTTDQNGEFEFDNIAQLRIQATQTGDQEHQQQRAHERDNDETFVLVVEAEGYETKEKEINLSDYLEDRAERGVMDQDRDRDRDMDRDRDDKDDHKIKIKLERSN